VKSNSLTQFSGGTMIQAPPQKLTLESFLALPETKPAYEFVHGSLVQKPMPQGEHSTLQRELIIFLTLLFKTSRCASAYPELRCSFGGRSIVPDIAVFLANRIPRTIDGRVQNTFSIAPDWTIEILSPGQSTTKVVKNILHCLEHGSQMGWLIDPSEQTVFVYRPLQAVQCFDSPEQIVVAPAFVKDFQLTIDELFGWLRT
jgi:Uma2 family endonuclease